MDSKVHHRNGSCSMSISGACSSDGCDSGMDLSREKQRWQRNQAIALAAFTLELSRFEIDLEPIQPTGLVSVHTQQANRV